MERKYWREKGEDSREERGRKCNCTLPFNRLQESEADFLGLAFMTMAEYDNNEAYKVWERMKEAQKGSPPEFLSTHPSPKNRIQKIKNWIPEVNARFT